MTKDTIREDVIIILNEREPVKQQLAVELEAQLKERNFCCVRLTPTIEICEIIIERNPRLLVTDYILGDYATGLDILSAIKNSKSQGTDIRSVMWTDESSANVAVSAMKLGAIDYLTIDTPKSLEKLINLAEALITESQANTNIASTKKLSKNILQKPIGQAINFQKVLTTIDGRATENTQILLLVGQQGTGRNTLAQYLHHIRPYSGRLIEIDYDLWDQPIQTLAGGLTESKSIPLLSYGNTVMIDHIEYDDGELLEYLSKNYIQSNDSCLILGTTQAETAAAWQRTLETKLVEVPALVDRKEDFWLLVEYFSTLVRKKPSDVKAKFSMNVCEAIRDLVWPGNVKQLRASVIETATNAKLITDGELPDEIKIKKITDEEKHTIIHLLEAKERWEKYSTYSTVQPEITLARKMLDMCNWNYRMAAARLGTGIPTLRNLFQQNGKAHNNQDALT